MAVSNLAALGLRAMTANYAALQTTGHNIANANVQGYSRQRAELSTSPGQFWGSGFYGRGVDVTTISRAHSAVLAREAMGAGSMAAMDAARLDMLRRMEGTFKTGEDGLGQAATQLLNGFAELATRPGDMAQRQVVLSLARDMAARFAAAGAQLDALQDGVRSELTTAVDQVNGLTESLARMNAQVVALRSLGQPPNDLLDERDRLLGRLNALVRVGTVEDTDGSINVFMAGGQSLVLGARTTTLRVATDSADPTRAALLMRTGGVDQPIGANLLGGGSIEGLLRFQNQDLVDGRNLVGRLALAVGMAVNAQQAMGLSLAGPAGEPPPPFFALGPSRALADAHNAAGPDGRPLAQVALQISDPAAVKASEYRLAQDENTPGLWRITRLVAGQPSQDPADRSEAFDIASLPGGEFSFQGMTLRLTAPLPQPGDRFTLQPATRAANGMAASLADPRDIAAAGPLVAFAEAGNRGTGAVSQLVFEPGGVPVPAGQVTVRFDDDAGRYSWELRDRDGNLLDGDSDTWVPGAPIPAPPRQINGFSLLLGGVPRQGDAFSIEPTPRDALSANNGNALRLTALRDAPLADGRTVTDAWALALADVGVRVRGAATAADISGQVAREAENARSGVTGVNLDEEAARLIQFQQSYQAAAKVLQVAQTLLDTLLQASGR
jgi:flagellar hook-associated protein 1 FlgK